MSAKCNFWKIGYTIKDPRSKKAKSCPKTAQAGPRRARWAQESPRWPEDGLEMVQRSSQNGIKMATKSAPGPRSDVAELHIFPDGPKWSELASRVGETRFLAAKGTKIAVLQLHQNLLPPSPPPLRDRVGTTKHVTSYILFRYIYIYIGV